jgi:glycyl-tRNA synthetase (class II)
LLELIPTILKKLTDLLKDKKLSGGNPLSKPRVFNMMIKTWIGAIEDDTLVVYLQP